MVASGKIQRCKPLICDVIELKHVALFPVIKAAADLHFLMARATIVQHEGIRDSLLLDAVKFRHDDPLLILCDTFLSTEVYVIKTVQLVDFGAKHLIKQVKRFVVSRDPVLDFIFGLAECLKVKEDLLSQATKFLQPSFAYNFTWHCCVKCVLSQLEVFSLIRVYTQ